MGTVYEVIRESDQRRLALKVLSGVSEALDMARFAREAQVASHVDHSNVVAIVDVDVTASGGIFLVMELVEGSSLQELSARYGDVPWGLRVLSQLADGLAAIHEVGIVHRDLKPANVLLKDPDAGPLSVKISDFGVSRLIGAEDSHDTISAPVAKRTSVPTVALGKGRPRSISDTDPAPPAPPQSGSLTETGTLLGTPIYMAPELAYGAKHAGTASDVFSLGVIAHEILTGRRPWAESPAFARLHGASVPPATPIGSQCVGLEVALADLFDACLSSSPAARPSAREIADALRGALGASRAAAG